jgi:hypothetical protein
VESPPIDTVSQMVALVDAYRKEYGRVFGNYDTGILFGVEY